MSIEQNTKILASDVVSSLSEKAPTSHASNDTTYGLGTDTNYGHVKLSDSVVSTLDALSGTATSPKAVDDGLSSLFDNIITAAENAVNTTNIPTNIATELSNRIDELSNDLVDLSGIKDDTILATQLASNLEEASTDILTYAELIEYIAKAERNTGLPLGTLLPYTGKDVPAGTLRADGSTYTNMRSTFPEFYTWVVESGLSVPIADYTLVEGSCGYYGIDDATGTVRMPTLEAGVFGTTEAGKYGQAVEAGLPNITGTIGYNTSGFVLTQTGAFYGTERTGTYQADVASTSTNLPYSKVTMDASRSSSVYGNSDTVTPAHVKYPWVIVVYNTAVTPSVAQVEEFVNLLELKANTNAENFSHEGKAMLARFGKPSSRTVELTLGATGSTYTSPASGYFSFAKTAGEANLFISLRNVTCGDMAMSITSPTSGGNLRAFMPVNAGDVVRVDYNATGDTIGFKFVYAVGEEDNNA